jgi:hypothetical protein
MVRIDQMALLYVHVIVPTSSDIILPWDSLVTVSTNQSPTIRWIYPIPWPQVMQHYWTLDSTRYIIWNTINILFSLLLLIILILIIIIIYKYIYIHHMSHINSIEISSLRIGQALRRLSTRSTAAETISPRSPQERGTSAETRWRLGCLWGTMVTLW